MCDMTPELRAESRSTSVKAVAGGHDLSRHGAGLTVEQIASSQRTSLDNARNYVKGTEAMLRGELPTAPSIAFKASRFYRYLLGECDLSPALHSCVKSCLRQLATSTRRSASRSHLAPPRRASHDSYTRIRHGAADCMSGMPHVPRGRMLLTERRVCATRLQ